MMRVRTVDSARVRDPKTGGVLTQPCDVPRTTYWMRRLRAGDIALAAPEPESPAEPTSEE